MHICKGLHNHFNHQVTPRLQLILRGIKKCQTGMNSTRTHLPVTVQLLHSIRSLLSKESTSYNNTTLWALCCLAFFGFLRVGEFTTPIQQAHMIHLDIYHLVTLQLITGKIPVLLKQSKTDIFKQGVKVYMGTTDSPVCPIKAILSYLEKRSRQLGLLFITKDGKG